MTSPPGRRETPSVLKKVITFAANISPFCPWLPDTVTQKTSAHRNDTPFQGATSPSRGHTRCGFIIAACCCIMMGVNVGLTFSCAGIFYRPVSGTLGVAVGEFGIYMYVFSTLMLSVAGRMLELWSARWIFTAACALMGLTFLAMSLFTTVWEFCLAGGVPGITLAFLLYLSFPTLVNRWFHTKVGLMTGVCSAASGIGGMLLQPLAG